MAQQTQNNRLIELGVAQVNMNERDQGLAIAALAQESARARVAAAAPDDLTDSSTGTADGGFALAAVVTPTVAVVDNVALLAPKAAFDTQIGLIEDAHEELRSKVNEFVVLVAGSTAAAVEATAGAAADDTIAAITSALTGSAADDQGVPSADGITQINTARNNQAALAAAVNYCRVAMGLDVISDGSGGMFNRTQSAYEMTDAAATGTAAANGENSLSETTVEAALAALNNNIASMAAALNEMRGTLAIGPFVVATHNPRSRFALADTTV